VHWVCVPGVQLPAPSQVAAPVATPAVQLATPQETVGKVQALVSVPLQLPTQAPVPAHAARVPTGAPVTGLQVPSFAGRLQAAHWRLVQSTSQQYPSAQTPLLHCEAPVQVVPLFWSGVQVPDAQ
jgi:hypothetical protein